VKIDIFCHVTPPRYLKAFQKKVSPEIADSLPTKGIPTLLDLEARFRVMDHYGGMVQVLTLTNPPVESVFEPDDALEMARIANDEMAELVAKHPDRFIAAVACLPMNDMDAALREADRAIDELHLKGVQLYTNILGKELDSPEFFPLFERMAQHDLPIWIHPFFQSVGKNVGAVAKDKDQFDQYRVFTAEKNQAWALDRSVFGMPAGTNTAVTRLVYSGLFDALPDIKLITHHCGGSIPYFANRIEMHYLMFGQQKDDRLGLEKPVLDYFKMVYGDSALHGNVAGLMCGYDFFGAEHMLFGTDMPFGAESGLWSVRRTIESVERMDITPSERALIFEGNARRLLRLAA
jgi:aminocarboxymuconate-semialdehyde decarboxylase